MNTNQLLRALTAAKQRPNQLTASQKNALAAIKAGKMPAGFKKQEFSADAKKDIQKAAGKDWELRQTFVKGKGDLTEFWMTFQSNDCDGLSLHVNTHGSESADWEVEFDKSLQSEFKSWVADILSSMKEGRTDTGDSLDSFFTEYSGIPEALDGAWDLSDRIAALFLKKAAHFYDE